MEPNQNLEWKDKKERKKRKFGTHALFWIICLEVIILLAGLAGLMWIAFEGSRQEEDSSVKISYRETEIKKVTYVPAPEIDEQLLTINKYSRPGEKIKSLDCIVIHYLGNPMTTGQQNHDYFESLRYLKNTSMSANYVIGLQGEIIQCVPDDEVAFASNQANSYSISIENCHPDATGRLTKSTYNSLVHLTAYLTEKYDLGRDQILRHYDITGKDCPKFFVEHEDRWERFLDEVMDYRQQCMDEALADLPQTEKKIDELTAFLESNAEENE